MERMLQWESMNELNAFRLLDCDPRVTVWVRINFRFVRHLSTIRGSPPKKAASAATIDQRPIQPRGNWGG